MKHVLTEAQRTAILAGGTEVELGEETPAKGTAKTPEILAAEAEAATAAAAAAAAAAKTTPVKDDAGVVNYLTTQLAAKDTALLAANVQVATLTQAATEASANLPGLLAIAQQHIGQMQVALGNSDTAAALSAKDAVAEHARVLPVFKAKFPTGGVSRLDPDATGEVVAPHPAFAERLANLQKGA